MTIPAIIKEYALHSEFIRNADRLTEENIMSMTKQHDMFYQFLDSHRDIFIALQRKAKKETLSELETLILHKVSGILADYTEDHTALAEECERRILDGISKAQIVGNA